MATRLSLSSLYGLSRGRWAAIALGTGAAGYVGVVLYRWQRRYSENRKQNGQWSRVAVFTSGVAVGVAAMAISPALRQWRCPRPERVFVSVLPMLRANTEVREAVGSSLRPGLFRAYTYKGGVRWNGVNWGSGVTLRGAVQSGRNLVSFHPYTLQLLFQVHGEVSSAMVSLAVRSHALWGRGLVYESLAVDFPHGERLVLKGSGTDSIFQGYTRLQQ